MRIIGFLQNKNEVQNGNLKRCLRSMAGVCDQIAVYDDCSDDEGVWGLYREFDCIVVRGWEKDAFNRELFHKRELLAAALRENPDFIVWFDSDAALSAGIDSKDKIQPYLEHMAANNADLMFLHNVNLWRSIKYARLDSNFNDLDHGVIWRVSPEMHYRPITQLHQAQYPYFSLDPEKKPIAIPAPKEINVQLLHFGFASLRGIADKYFRYRSYGQQGESLDRLVREEGLELQEIPLTAFPDWMHEDYKNANEKPEPILPGNIADFVDLESYLNYLKDRKIAID